MIGLCPWVAKENDLIAILNGGKVPYLLRETRKLGNSDGETKYTLVGECYVMGIMDGEFFKAQQASGRDLNEFILV